MEESVKTLSLKQQIYLETIFDLCREHGHAHVKSIAERLKNRMPSVTEAMRGLAAKNLVNYDIRKTVSLSPQGLEIALELDKRHSVLAEFYSNVLGCSRSQAEAVACEVEHVVDAEFCSRLAEFAAFIRGKSENGIDLIGEFKTLYNSSHKKVK
ncbi:MAG: metal-dependent transcriptional regulator [Victivallaceae bacterium]